MMAPSFLRKLGDPPWDLLLRYTLDDACPFSVVLVAGDFSALAMISQQMLNGGAHARPVESVARVGQGDEQDAAGPQHPRPVFERRDWVFDVLKDMVGDHEVD